MPDGHGQLESREISSDCSFFTSWLRVKQAMNKIKPTLTLEEVNALLDALGAQSFKQVHQLITKIQTQATSQLQDAQHDNAEDSKIK